MALKFKSEASSSTVVTSFYVTNGSAQQERQPRKALERVGLSRVVVPVHRVLVLFAGSWSTSSLEGNIFLPKAVACFTREQEQFLRPQDETEGALIYWNWETRRHCFLTTRAPHTLGLHVDMYVDGKLLLQLLRASTSTPFNFVRHCMSILHIPSGK